MRRTLTYLIIALLAIASCGAPEGRYVTDDAVPGITPDYTDITIPVNIAPLNFELEGASELVVEVSGSEDWVFRSKGGQMCFPLKKWKKMLSVEKGNVLSVTLKAEFSDSAVKYAPFWWKVAEDPIDRYLSYRLIEPAYEVWNMITVEERDLESFKVRVLADNNITSKACINCHTSNRAAGCQTNFMHVRGKSGGTMYSRNGEIRKVNTATDSTAGAAVYGEISADGRWGIFTTADIRNCLHSARLERLEVYDASSDLIVVDFENGTVSDSPLVKGSEYQETFPCFSADGRTVYFCRSVAREQPADTKDMHYDLCAIAFDSETGRLGDTIETLIDAASIDKSFSFPKCSPDGSRILVCASEYGTFPIWHTDTDLWMYDISTGELDFLENVNGDFADSYHCWSSSGRWICWASKRDDRAYGRPYFAFVDENGSVSKPFVLPQRMMELYRNTLKSYNIPELYDAPEIYDAFDVSRFYSDMDCEKMTYLSR